MTTIAAGAAQVSDAALYDAVAGVADPELPMVTIADLGILRDATYVDGVPTVTLTPTYSGCPAVAEIARDVAARAQAATGHEVVVRLAIAPPWTSDWITPSGRRKLHEAGIAPPSGCATAPAGPVPLQLGLRTTRAPCPHCGSEQTRRTADFSATACRSLHRCEDCDEPFEQIKAI